MWFPWWKCMTKKSQHYIDFPLLNRPIVMQIEESFYCSVIMTTDLLSVVKFIISGFTAVTIITSSIFHHQFANITLSILYLQTENLNVLIDGRNKELETRFIFQQKDIKFFVHTLMQKYVTPRSRNVRKQNSRLCSCWVHMLRRSSIYSNRN